MKNSDKTIKKIIRARFSAAVGTSVRIFVANIRARHCKRRVNFSGAMLLLWGIATMLMGCGGTVQSAHPDASAVSIEGRVHGGQQPVSGATVQLYTVGTTGPRSLSQPLLHSTVQTDATGYFNITGLYNCDSATQVYIVATGGNSGYGSNSAITLAAALGPCANLLANAANIFIALNEITTVAAAYALAPFASDYLHIGATGANPSGLVNAFANAASLADVSTGSSPGANLAVGVTAPATTINTIADILAACINTMGASSSGCTSLLSVTSTSNTFDAALGMAKNPGSSTVTSLYTLVTGTATPFQPTLSSAPNDFSIALRFTGSTGTLNFPYGIAIDAAGNAWVTNEAGSTVVRFSNTGTVLSIWTGLTGPQGIAIDEAGNIWIANTAADSVVKLSTLSGSVTGASTLFAGGGNGPVSIALDSTGNAWVANYISSTVTELNSTGAVVLSGLTGSSTITRPTSIALDKNGNVWVASSGTGAAVRLTHAGSLGSVYTDNALQGSTAIMLDSSSNVWVTGNTTGSVLAGAVSQFDSTGAAATYSPIAAGSQPLAGIATDNSSAWAVNNVSAGRLFQFQLGQAAPISPASGFGNLSNPIGVAVDASGDVWTTNAGDNSISLFIGLAAPVSTPLAVNVEP